MIDLPGESFAFISVAIAITVLSPRLLSQGRLIVNRPHIVIGLWVAALSVSIVGLLAGTGVLIREAIARTVAGESPEHWPTSVAGSILAWLSLAVLGVLAFRILDAAQNLWDERRAEINRITPLLHTASFSDDGKLRSYLVSADDVLLTALPFANAIVLSTATRDALEAPDEYAAAIEHERAHLSGKHSMLVFASRLAMTAAGGFRASQRFTQTIRIAIELVADDHAARAVGAEPLANALEKLFPERPDVHDRIRRLRVRNAKQ